MLNCTVSDVHRLLRKYNACIVHFSGTPKGHGKKIYYSDDLRNVLAGNASSGICCSVVIPGDAFDGAHRNAFGCVGVLVDFNSEDSLMNACDGDCGSTISEDQRIVYKDRNVTFDLKYLEQTIVNRVQYNSWVLRNFKIIGVFAASPYVIFEEQRIDFEEDMFGFEEDIVERGPGTLDLSMIRDTSQGQRLLSFNGSDIVEVVSGEFHKTSHEAIYE